MKNQDENTICEERISSVYNEIREKLEDNTIICNHLGTFSQSMLISIVSLIERALNSYGESDRLKKRLIYIVIECVQNIIYHSNKQSDNHQLAYLVLAKNDKGYVLYSSNSMEVSYVNDLVIKLDELLKVKPDILSKVFTKKISNPNIDESNRGGIGLLTMIEKSEKNFQYEILKVSNTYALFIIQINLLYKNLN